MRNLENVVLNFRIGHGRCGAWMDSFVMVHPFESIRELVSVDCYPTMQLGKWLRFGSVANFHLSRNLKRVVSYIMQRNRSLAKKDWEEATNFKVKKEYSRIASYFSMIETT